MHAVQTFELVLLLLGAVVALQWLAERVGLPPSAALLVGGGALAFLPGIPAIELDPELALVLFLPPLLLDGAYYTAFGRFRRHLPGILSLAIGAVIFTTLVVGVAVHWLLPELPWPACFALGAIVSPPDAVAARAVLQRVQLPRRLQALLEGESLLNDATGLVLFRFAVAATLSGVFNAGEAVGQFALLSLGGIAVGIAVGYLWVWILRRLENETLVVTTATLLCWVAYLAGEAIQVSGVIACVTAGLIFGWYQHVIMPAAVRLQGSAFWRTLTFALEAMVFILIGSSLRSVLDRAGGVEQVLTNMWGPVAFILLAVIVARFTWVFTIEYILTALCRLGWKRARPLGERQATILAWTGMRGVVTLAVALTLPANIPGRDFMLVAAFAVILMTVVVQGSTLGLLIRWLNPRDFDPPAKVPLPEAEACVARAKLAAAEQHAYDSSGELIHPQLLDTYQKRAAATEKYAREPDGFMQNIRGHFTLMLKAVTAGRAELIRLHRAGDIEDETLHNLERDLDLEELGILYQRDG